MTAPISYLITTDVSGQVRLSRVGSWGNIPKPSDVQAEADAQADAKGRPFLIQRHRLAPLPPVRVVR